MEQVKLTFLSKPATSERTRVLALIFAIETVAL